MGNSTGMTHRWNDEGILSVVFDVPGERLSELSDFMGGFDIDIGGLSE